MTQRTFKEARSRYKRLFMPMMLAYLVIVLGGSFWLAGMDAPPLALSAAVAIASALPLIAALWLMLRYFSETDEFTRLRQLTAFARGAVIIISAIFIAGFLQMFDVIGNIEVFWFGPAFFLAYGLAYKAMGGKDC